jgi:hypothetical protein
MTEEEEGSPVLLRHSPKSTATRLPGRGSGRVPLAPARQLLALLRPHALDTAGVRGRGLLRVPGLHDGAQRHVPQVRHVRQHEWVQLKVQ